MQYSHVHVYYFLTGVQYKVFVRSGARETITLEVEPSDTIKTVKAKIHGKEGIPPEYQRMDFAGKWLEDWCALSYYNVMEDATLYLEIKPQKGNQL